MQEIADEAGINKAMLHYYFRSKGKLFEAVFEAGIKKVLPPAVEQLASDHPLGLKIRRFIETYLENMSRNPKLPGFIIAELNRNPDHLRNIAMAEIAPALPKIRSQLAEAVAEGRVRAISAEDLICNLISMCLFPLLARPVFQSILQLEGGKYDEFLARRTETVTDFVFNALRP